MSIFGKLFKKRDSAAQNDKATSSAADPASDPNLIRVFDKFGREFFISREEWRTNVLPAALKSHWDQPDQLCDTIITALNDGFVAEVDSAAERLYQLEPNSSQNVCVCAIVHLKNERLDEAETVLRSFLEKNGDDGSVLTNLAKVFAARSDTEKQDETLWHALTVDPNQDNALAWYEALARERSGEEAALNGLSRIAQHPNSWRPQLWLARAALKANDLPRAINYYREGLSHVASNVPADLLMQMSGDLGNEGHLAELLTLTEPYFDPEQHGLRVGNNLIKANLDFGHIDVARKIVDQLYSLKRPDWKETLGYWDTQIAKSRVGKATGESTEPLSMTMLSIEGPVWLKPDSPATKIFPVMSKDGPLITFLGSSATTSNRTQTIQPQMPDAPGRMSRALPLFLAEQVSFASEANVQTFIPWISEGSGGFVLSGVAWTDGNALEYVRRSETKTKYVVVTHLTTGSDPWTVDLRVLQTSNGECVAELQSSFARSIPGEPVVELSRRLINMLTEQLQVKTVTIPLYQVPNTAYISDYLLRLEQLLAVRCAGMEGVPREFLHVEREIIDGSLQLCLTTPSNIATRILLVQTLLTMNKIRPEVVREFADKVAMLQKDKPLAEPAQSIVQEMLSAVGVK
jgi:tetratricopeptide (TPR) repeat protein